MKWKAIFLVTSLVLTSLWSTGVFVPAVIAQASNSSDSTYYDSYDTNWFGIRPTNAPMARIIYDQKVENCGEDIFTAIGLSAHVYSLYTDIAGTTDDEVEVRVITSANGRKGITYAMEGPYDAVWGNPGGKDTGIDGDDEGVWINLPFPVSFFGAPSTLSGVYSKVWVCSNGFLSFTDESTSLTPQFGQDEPNTVIAPFWRDLDPSAGGTISTYYNFEIGCFQILWDDVPDKNGNQQSFKVWIDGATCWGQNTIEFIYGPITGGVTTVVGIEDQYGGRAYTINPSQLSSDRG